MDRVTIERFRNSSIYIANYNKLRKLLNHNSKKQERILELNIFIIMFNKYALDNLEL